MTTCTPIARAHADRLKREAWTLKKTTPIKHAEALRQVAQREGYASWEALMRNVAVAEDGSLESNVPTGSQE